MPKLDVRSARGSGLYRKLRATFLNQNPLCVKCQDRGKTVAATELDHIVPVHRSPDRFWDTSNWQALCRPCHEAKTAEENTDATEWRDYIREQYGTG